MSVTRAPSAPTEGVDIVEFVMALTNEVRKAVESPSGVKFVQQVNALALAADEALRPFSRWANDNRAWLAPMAEAMKDADDARLAATRQATRTAKEEAEWAAVRAAGPSIEVVETSGAGNERPPYGKGGYRN